MDYGIDTNRTFGLKELLIFTDFLEVPQTRFTRQCDRDKGEFPCLVKGCYKADQICNGRPDCEDGRSILLAQAPAVAILMTNIYLADQAMCFKLLISRWKYQLSYNH